MFVVVLAIATALLRPGGSCCRIHEGSHGRTAGSSIAACGGPNWSRAFSGLGLLASERDIARQPQTKNTFSGSSVVPASRRTFANHGMAFSGVRSSWLSVAGNSSLVRFARQFAPFNDVTGASSAMPVWDSVEEPRYHSRCGRHRRRRQRLSVSDDSTQVRRPHGKTHAPSEVP